MSMSAQEYLPPGDIIQNEQLADDIFRIRILGKRIVERLLVILLGTMLYVHPDQSCRIPNEHRLEWCHDLIKNRGTIDTQVDICIRDCGPEKLVSKAIV